MSFNNNIDDNGKNIIIDYHYIENLSKVIPSEGIA